MKIRNIKVGKQLTLGFAFILVLILVIGVVAFTQTGRLHQQTEEMYEHPLRVRKALDTLENNILSMQLGMTDILLAEDQLSREEAQKAVALSMLSADRQFSVLQSSYLGKAADVETAYNDYILWKSVAEKIIEAAIEGGATDAALDALRNSETLTTYRNSLSASIAFLDDFAQNKADTFYNTSVELKGTLNLQLALLIACVLVLSTLIIWLLQRSIVNPINLMRDAVRRFHQGDEDSRVLYESGNEFGALASSINMLADSVQSNDALNQKTNYLADVMVAQNDCRAFFRATLDALAESAGAQMAAVYLLNEDSHTFEPYESIGMQDAAKLSFRADSFEGEFGLALSSRKMQYLQDIPDDTQFLFYTASGVFKPKAILTVPILSENRVIAMLSLATVKSFAPLTLELLRSITRNLNARVESVLANTRIVDYKDTLEAQNRELESQKSELAAQSAELAQQNMELAQQKNQLSEISQLKTDFLSNTSHELRTPLNSVIALSGLLCRKLIHQIPAEEYGYLEIIERNGKNLLALINDILDISRIEAGRMDIDIAPFNVTNLVADITAMLNPLAEAKNIRLESKIKTDIVATTDADKCRHILQNLMNNAIKFTEQGSVTVSAKRKQNEVIIAVADTGIGIAQEHLPFIFDEFRQADGSTSRKFGGTGLGLAIAKKYANMLGGDITVQSTVGKGSVFTLTLPAALGVEAALEDDTADINAYGGAMLAAPPSGNTAAGKNVLIVDDNESAMIQLRDLLADMGATIWCAQDAAEAFGFIHKAIPDVIILDLMMPEVDGFSVLEQLRNAEATAQVPILILTAKNITKDELKFLKRNNISQLIQKGDVDRLRLQSAVVKVLFPRSDTPDSHDAPDTPETPRHSPMPTKNEKRLQVLVVEDNPDNMLTVKALLSDRFDVLEAIDGPTGLAQAKKYIPDLILMDIALPGISGIETFERIRKLPRLQGIPVIALTASAMEQDREAILSHGFNAFVAKPIIAQQFFRAIQEVLNEK